MSRIVQSVKCWGWSVDPTLTDSQGSVFSRGGGLSTHSPQTPSSRPRVPLGRQRPVEAMPTLRNGWCLEPEERGRSRECCLGCGPCTRHLIRLPSNARPLHSAPPLPQIPFPSLGPLEAISAIPCLTGFPIPQSPLNPAPNFRCSSSMEVQRLAVVVLHRAGLSWAMYGTSRVPSRCPPSAVQHVSQSLG